MSSRSFFRCLAWILVLAVAAFSLSPIALRPVTDAPADLERLAAFAAIGAAFGLGYPGRRFGTLFLLLAGVAILEVGQQLVPGRHAHLHDAGVKAFGVLLGIAAASAAHRIAAGRVVR